MDRVDKNKDAGGYPVDALVAKRIGVSYDSLTEEALEDHQLEAFKRTLRYAKERSDFYAHLYEGIDADDIKSMDDIRKLPFTSEEDLSENEWRFLCKSASDVDRIVTVPTTGTSGKQKKLSFSFEDQQKAIEFIRAGYEVMNCKDGEKMLILMSGTSAGSIGDLVKKAVEPLGMTIEVFGSVTDIKKAYDKLLEYRPSVVEALPWHAAALASYGKRFGNPEKEFIRSVNLSADVVPDSVTERIERLWDCSVHRHYGSTEMCIFGGVECTSHEGYHIRGCDILYEITNADENGIGEMVITTLDRKVMPLIRYKTGDIAKFTDKECSCGGKLKRILKVYGRKRNIISFGSHSFMMPSLADAIFRIDEAVDFDICIANEDMLSICIKTLPGESIERERVLNELIKIDELKCALCDGSLKLDLSFSETESFASGYDLKKDIKING